MGLGIFNRNRKSLIVPPVPSAQPLELRVLVDAGPAARDAFTISVPAEGTVDSIREAAAAHIGRTGIALFKVSMTPPYDIFHHSPRSCRACGAISRAPYLLASVLRSSVRLAVRD